MTGNAQVQIWVYVSGKMKFIPLITLEAVSLKCIGHIFSAYVCCTWFCDGTGYRTQRPPWKTWHVTAMPTDMLEARQKLTRPFFKAEKKVGVNSVCAKIIFITRLKKRPLRMLLASRGGCIPSVGNQRCQRTIQNEEGCICIGAVH